MVDGVVGERGRDGAGYNTGQSIRAADSLKIQIVKVGFGCIRQGSDALIAERVCEANTRKTTAQLIADKRGEALAVGNVVQQVLRAERGVIAEQVFARQNGSLTAL